MYFSLIIPVYNRPDEVNELLQSLLEMTYGHAFEIVVVEDGSTQTCEDVVKLYSDRLDISYYYKVNSGPGDSRNFGMQKAKGDYFIIFDSDCIIPPNYLTKVHKALSENYVDCFGGPDQALDSFSDIQKAINFAMTSFLTTGGVRGGSEKISRFQPRSFNMGISRTAFISSGGFGKIHPGEDPDLSIRLWQLGYHTMLIQEAFVYHKRRIDWNKFYIQVNKFGKARPILDSWYPDYAKPTFFLPTFFLLGILCALSLSAIGWHDLTILYSSYLALLLLTATVVTGNFKIGILAVLASMIQFYGYGTGFLTSFIKVRLFGRRPQDAFPELFFK
jgi:glycosyltransferase involved in cell wall biosynthesis